MQITKRQGGDIWEGDWTRGQWEIQNVPQSRLRQKPSEREVSPSVLSHHNGTGIGRWIPLQQNAFDLLIHNILDITKKKTYKRKKKHGCKEKKNGTKLWENTCEKLISFFQNKDSTVIEKDSQQKLLIHLPIYRLKFLFVFPYHLYS